jgi:hypothetical protein
MNDLLANPPTEGDLIHGGKVIMEEFSPESLAYLDPAGRWNKNPETLRECVSNELLYFLWKRGEKERAFFIRSGLTVFLEEKVWALTKKIVLILQEKGNIDPNDLDDKEIGSRISQAYSAGVRSKKIVPFLIVLEGLGWVIACEAMLINSRLRIPSWDPDARAQRREIITRLQEMTNLTEGLSAGQERTFYLPHISERLNAAFPEFLSVLAPVIAEEDRLAQTIGRLLAKADEEKAREDALSMIIEKILPPMGIVTQTSPALLRPCIRLLLNPQIEIESGIPYNASVVLSILQDPRSTEALLKALHDFPLHLSKIRENLIYTLGNLGERKAAGLISAVLEEDDELIFTSGRGNKNFCLLLEQKEEALIALGKIGLASLPSLPVLTKYAEHPSPKVKTYLAWALGEIGKLQKIEYGGVSADIIIALLRLLKTKHKKVFEESVDALKKIDMPEFIHSLYLYNVGAVNILGLKPAQKGLYELSETIHFLIRKKGQAIIAVNGDSGTGKTYFCQSLTDGFGDIRPGEILYMMRDRKKDQKVFNKILGLRWLKTYIDPVYYHDYPFSEEEDNPEKSLDDFLIENGDKKLIILDGCRDRDYFQRVIDLFYFRDRLDVEINFRSTQSTRRFNLEEREIALESVRTHLSFLEDPALEDTYIYREGKALLYDLDNSINCRLAREEIKELFSQERIESWGEFIRVGDFKKEAHLLKPGCGNLRTEEEPFALKTYGMDKARHESLPIEERKFRMDLNQDLSNEPHLIGTIDAEDLKPEQIRFYAQNQIAGRGEEGGLFILTFLDSRIFSTVVEKCQGLSLSGRKIFSIDSKGECTLVHFENNEKIRLPKTDSPALVSAALSTDRVITGHGDGSITIWNFTQNSTHILEGHERPVLALAADYYGRIFSAASDASLKRWDLERGRVSRFSGFPGNISRIVLYPQKKLLAVAEEKENGMKVNKIREDLLLLDLEGLLFQSVPSPLENKLIGLTVHSDGRIFVTYRFSTGEGQKTLVLIAPAKNSWGFKMLDSHERDTRDCLIMGPRLITCGTESNGNHTIRLWGTEDYVRTELNKMIALSGRA